MKSAGRLLTGVAGISSDGIAISVITPADEPGFRRRHGLRERPAVHFLSPFIQPFLLPVFTVLFLDCNPTLEQFALLNLVWALSIVVAKCHRALADIIGHKRLLVFAALLMVLEWRCSSFATGCSRYCFSCSCSTESVPVCRKRLPAVLTKRWPTIRSNLWGGRMNGLKFWSGRHGL